MACEHTVPPAISGSSPKEPEVHVCLSLRALPPAPPSLSCPSLSSHAQLPLLRLTAERGHTPGGSRATQGQKQLDGLWLLSARRGKPGFRNSSSLCLKVI